MTSTRRIRSRRPQGRSVVAALALAGAASAAGASPLRLASVSFEEVDAVTTNGRPEPGETGRLRVGLTIDEGPAQSGITGRLSVVGPPGVAVVSDAASWRDLGPRTCAEDDGLAGEFVISLDAAVACGAVVELVLELSSEPSGTTSLATTLEIGSGGTAALELGELSPGPSAARASMEWNGEEYGLAWSRRDGSRTEFVRLDGDGVPLGSPHRLVGEGSSFFPAVAHGDGRWAVARLQDRLLVLWLLDQTGETTEIEIGTLPEGLAAGPAIAWDGTGWSLVMFVARPGGRDPELIHFFHASPDGSVTEGPTVIDPGLRLVDPPVLIWNGDELVLLLRRWLESRLAFLSTAGDLLHVGPPLRDRGGRGRLAWNGRAHALAFLAAEPEVMMLDRCGEPLTDLVSLDVVDLPERRDDFVWGDGAIAITAEGRRFAAAASYRAPIVGTFDEYEQWVTFYRFDESARLLSPPQRITPADDEGWGLSGDMAWNPDRGVHVVPVIHDADWENVIVGVGQLSLAQVAVEPRCTSAEPPPEVSAPGSGVPLLARKRIRSNAAGDHADVVLSVQDLGPVATSYNAYYFFGERDTPIWEDCHHRVGGESPAIPVPPDRVELTMEWPYTIESSSFRGHVHSFRVSASNEAGEGPLGADSLGRRVPQPNGCLATP